MKHIDENATDKNRTGRQFEVEQPAKSNPKVRAGKDFKPSQTEEQDNPPQSIVTGERLPNLIDYSYQKL